MYSYIGIRLRLAREAKRLTQVQVKKLTNIHNKTLSGYEKEVSEPDIRTLRILANLYETSIDYLVGNTDDPTPPQARKNVPDFEDIVLSAPTLKDAYLRIVKLHFEYRLDKETFVRLSELAFDMYCSSPKDREI